MIVKPKYCTTIQCNNLLATPVDAADDPIAPFCDDCLTLKSNPLVRAPFLVSVGDRLYVHFSKVTQKQATEAYKGILTPVFDQIASEIRKTDGRDQVKVRCQLAWGNSLDTVSLSEAGLTAKRVCKNCKSSLEDREKYFESDALCDCCAAQCDHWDCKVLDDQEVED